MVGLLLARFICVLSKQAIMFVRFSGTAEGQGGNTLTITTKSAAGQHDAHVIAELQIVMCLSASGVSIVQC